MEMIFKMYAIIETGGKQFKVSVGDVIRVEKLGVEAGAEFTFDNVLAVADAESGKAPVFGTPYVPGAAVIGSVIRDGREKKVIIYKFKAKKTFHKKKGHRQPFTEVRINKINA
jgi:large subunit ribosomal protein L21